MALMLVTFAFNITDEVTPVDIAKGALVLLLKES